MRIVEGGFVSSFETGRSGRGAKFPPQLGQTPRSLLSTQSRQNVHSNVQIMASVADGGRSLSQHSQLGRSSSIGNPHWRSFRNAGNPLWLMHCLLRMPGTSSQACADYVNLSTLPGIQV